MLLSSSDQEYAVPFNGSEIWMNCKDIYFHIKWMMKDESWKSLQLGESARSNHSALELGREGCLDKCTPCERVVLNCPFGTSPELHIAPRRAFGAAPVLGCGAAVPYPWGWQDGCPS